MKNSFDDKIKEAFENFEMPYDANAWAELEKQLPKHASAGNSGGGAFSTWKIAALVAVAALATSIWYLSKDPSEKPAQSEQVAIDTPKANDAEDNPILKITAQSKTEISSDPETTPSIEDPKTGKRADTETEGIADVDEDIFRSSEQSENTEAMNAVEESKITTGSPVEVAPTASKESSITVSFIASTVTACVNQDVSFINESVAKSAQMVWDFGDGNTSTEKDPIHSYIAPGNYTVTLRAEGKIDVVEKTADIKVDPVPTPAFSAERKLNGYQAIPLYAFSTSIQPDERATWSFSDGQKVVGTETAHLFRDAGKHTAKLTVTNGFGCSTSMEQEFSSARFNLLAPTAFTPDGDGINEAFIPKAVPVMGIPFEMTVQDSKTGQIVYRTEDAAAPWNGTLNNAGIELENGLYVWTVVLKEPVVQNRVFTETIQLKR